MRLGARANVSGGCLPSLTLIVGSNDMTSLVYPSLLGLAGAACSVAAAMLSHIEGQTVSPSDYRFLLVLCWLGTALGAGGAAWALIIRTRSARREISTLVIASCLAVVVLSFWIRTGALPHYIGVPMTLPSRHEGANKRPPGNGARAKAPSMASPFEPRSSQTAKEATGSE